MHGPSPACKELSALDEARELGESNIEANSTRHLAGMPTLRYSLIAISVLVALFAAGAGGFRLAGFLADGGSVSPILVWAAIWVVSTAILVLEISSLARRRDAGNSLESLIEAVPVGLALYDAQGNLVHSNEIFRRTATDPASLQEADGELDLGPQGRVRILRHQLSDGASLVSALDITHEARLRSEKRDAAARLSQFLTAAADWTWETDVLHRFTAVAKVDDDGDCPPLDGMIGYNLVELALDNVGMNDWSAEECLRDMDRHLPLHDRSLRLVLEDFVCGIRLYGVPRFDESGGFLGYRGFGRREVVAPLPETEGRTAPLPRKAGVRGPLLLVDDSVTNRLLAQSILSKMGYEVAAVEGGREAVEAVRTGNYAAVLMDIWMPEMDGFEATAAIRALPPPLGEIPVIAMTAHAGEEERRKCLEAGMDEHVAKPIDRAFLASVLRKFVGPANRTLLAPEVDVHTAPDMEDLVNDEVLDQLRNDAGPALVNELIGAYMAETDDRLVRMEAALDARNFDEIGADAHSMKSSSGTFGALQLQALAARLEAAAMAEDFETLTEAHKGLPELVSGTWAAFAERGISRD